MLSRSLVVLLAAQLFISAAIKVYGDIPPQKKSALRFDIIVTAGIAGRLADFNGHRSFGIWPAIRLITELKTRHPQLIRLDGGDILPLPTDFKRVAPKSLTGLSSWEYYHRQLAQINYHFVALSSQDLNRDWSNYHRGGIKFGALNFESEHYQLEAYQLISKADFKLLVSSFSGLKGNLAVDLTQPANKWRLHDSSKRSAVASLPAADLKLLFIDEDWINYYRHPNLKLLGHPETLGARQIIADWPEFDIYILTGQELHHPPIREAGYKYRGKTIFHLGKDDERALFLQVWLEKLDNKSSLLKTDFKWLLPPDSRLLTNQPIYQKLKQAQRVKVGWNVKARNYSSASLRACLRNMVESALQQAVVSKGFSKPVPKERIFLLIKPFRTGHLGTSVSVDHKMLQGWLSDKSLYALSLSSSDLNRLLTGVLESGYDLKRYYQLNLDHAKSIATKQLAANEPWYLVSSADFLLNSTLFKQLWRKNIKPLELVVPSLTELIIGYMQNNPPPLACQKIFAAD